MSTSTPTKPGALDALEFEFTDFAAARAASEDVPAGIGRLHEFEPGYWEAKRRRLTPADRALTGTALDWIMTLPPTLRPRHLCERFPRLANALAEVWNHAGHREAFVDSLMTDRRGGRAGFPAEIRREIELLRRAMP